MFASWEVALPAIKNEQCLLCGWHAPVTEQLATTLLCQEYVGVLASVCNSLYFAHLCSFIVFFFFPSWSDTFMFWYELSVCAQSVLSSLAWGRIAGFPLWLAKPYLEYTGVFHDLLVICVTQIGNYWSDETAKRIWRCSVISPGCYIKTIKHLLISELVLHCHEKEKQFPSKTEYKNKKVFFESILRSTFCWFWEAAEYTTQCSLALAM